MAQSNDGPGFWRAAASILIAVGLVVAGVKVFLFFRHDYWPQWSTCDVLNRLQPCVAPPLQLTGWELADDIAGYVFYDVGVQWVLIIVGLLMLLLRPRQA